VEETIFTKIIAGKIPASFVYQDERVSAFLDIQGVNPGHTLVIPNTPAALFQDVDPETAKHMFAVAQQIATKLRSGIVKCDDINLLMSDGPAAGQEVPHCHLHVIPRIKGDSFRFGYKREPWDESKREGMAELAKKLKID